MRHIAIAFGVLVVGGCSTASDPQYATVSSAETTAGHEVERPGAPAVSVDWTISNTMKGLYSSDTFLTGRINNFTSVSQPVHLYLTADGLDQRLALRDLAVWNVPAASGPLTPGTTNVSVRLSDIPVQSVGMQSEVELQAVYHEGAADQVIAASNHVYYSFNSGYSTANLYAYDGVEAGISSPPGSSLNDLMLGISSSANVLTATGRYLAAAGGWVNVAVGRPPIGTNRGLQSYWGSGQRLRGMEAAAWYDNITVEQSSPAAPGPNTFFSCSTWRAEYLDYQPTGGLILPLQNISDFPARYSQYLVERMDSTGYNHVAWVAKGFLDGNGCSMRLSLSPGAYKLWQFTTLDRGATTPYVKVMYGGWNPSWLYTVGPFPKLGSPPPPPWGAYADFGNLIATGFTTGAVGSTTTIPLVTSGFDVASNAAAHVGIILSKQSSLGLERFGTSPVTPFVVYANILANDGTTGFFIPPPTQYYGVYLGPSEYTPHNARYRSIIAHEFGHGINYHKMGLSNWNKAEGVSITPACDVAHVKDPTANSHCLQSRQVNGFAINEGFAHFFAAMTAQVQSPTNCTFMYYKEFREDDTTVVMPPLAKPCAFAGTPTKWAFNHCALSGATVEWDWLNFFWRIANDANYTSMNELALIYRGACGGNNCLGSFVNPANGLTFNALSTAAGSVLSGQTLIIFNNSGQLTGVNYP